MGTSWEEGEEIENWIEILVHLSFGSLEVFKKWAEHLLGRC